MNLNQEIVAKGVDINVAECQLQIPPHAPTTALTTCDIENYTMQDNIEPYTLAADEVSKILKENKEFKDQRPDYGKQWS